MKLEMQVIDAFTNERFKGNSAAVIITDDSEGTWAVARATSPAFRAKLRQCWPAWQSCMSPKHEARRTASAPVLMPGA